MISMKKFNLNFKDFDIKNFIKYLIIFIVFVGIAVGGILMVDYNNNMFMGNNQKITVVEGLFGG